MDTSELNERLPDEKEAFYDITKRNNLIEQDAKEKEERKNSRATKNDNDKGGTSGSASGGVDSTRNMVSKEEKANAEYTEYVESVAENQHSDEAEVQQEVEKDTQAVQDITRMWNLYKQSHPDAKIEDMKGNGPEPTGGSVK